MCPNSKSSFAAVVSVMLLFVAVSAFSAPVRFETAESVAKKHLERKRGGKGGGDVEKIRRGSAHKTKTSFTPYYVFEKGDKGGFIIVSADDVAAPVLGETDRGVFDKDSMPPALVWLLGTYERQIEEAVRSGGTRDSGTMALWERAAQSSGAVLRRLNAATVARYPLQLLSTRWKQDEPYNLKTPLDGGKNSAAGCVATAMAQIIKYWRYPDSGAGESKAYRTKTREISVPSVSFKIPYNYADMLDDYPTANSGNTSQRGAVSTLIYHSGVSVGMDYKQTESFAYSEDAATALVRNFKYDNNIRYIESIESARSWNSDNYLTNDWKDLILGQIENNSPVYYCGYDTINGIINGHAFIIDGYDEHINKFHINWGWGGSSDGFFALTALNPDTRRFDDGHSMIINIMPKTNGNPPSQIKVTDFNVSVTPLEINVKITSKMNYGNDYTGFIGFAVTYGDSVGMVLDSANLGIYNAHDYRFSTYTINYVNRTITKRLGADTPVGDVTLRPVVKRLPEDEWTPIGSTRKIISIPPPRNIIGEWSCGMGSSDITAVLIEDGTLIIYGDGWMQNYYTFGAYSGAPWSFSGTQNLITNVVITDGVKSIGNNAFEGCANLTSVSISSSVAEINKQAFFGCTNLTSVTIPDGVTYIGPSAFYGCASLTSVAIGNGVTQVGSSAFYGCTNLTSVTIGNSVKYIDYTAFYDCRSMTSVDCLNPVPPTLENYVFYVYDVYNGRDALSSACLYVPRGSIDAYASVYGWKDFGCINPLQATAVLASDRVVPTVGFDDGVTAVAPVSVLTAEFAAGPNPAGKSSGLINFFRNGSRIASASLSIYDAYGNVVRKIGINDNAVIGNNKIRQVGSWDLTDRKGRRVPVGTYLVKGVLKTSGGKNEKVSLIAGVR
jgi:hypothetical protein